MTKEQPTKPKKAKSKKPKTETVVEKDEVVMAKCGICQKDFPESELSKGKDTGDMKFCKKCWDVAFFKCSDCGTIHSKTTEATNRISKDRVLCTSCFTKEYAVCGCCFKILPKADIKTVEGRGTFCPSCYANTFTTCFMCGVGYEKRNTKYDEEGHTICGECYKKVMPVWGSSVLLKDLRKSDAVGIEVECYPKDNIEKIAMKNKKAVSYFHLGTDGSLGSGGIEMVTVPIPIGKLEEVMKDCSSFLSNFLARKECGMHIHMNMYPYLDFKEAKMSEIGDAIKRVMVGFMNLESYLFSTQPSNRRHNSYCKRITEVMDIDSIDDMVDIPNNKVPCFVYGSGITKERLPFGNKSHDSRYCWLNVHSMIFRNTLEIRLHSGSVNEKKMYLWCSAMVRILNWIMKHDIEEIYELDQDKLPEILMPEELAYLEERRARWSGGDCKKVNVPYATARRGEIGKGIHVEGETEGKADFLTNMSKSFALEEDGLTMHKIPELIGVIPLNLSNEESE